MFGGEEFPFFFGIFYFLFHHFVCVCVFFRKKKDGHIIRWVFRRDEAVEVETAGEFVRQKYRKKKKILM